MICEFSVLFVYFDFVCLLRLYFYSVINICNIFCHFHAMMVFCSFNSDIFGHMIFHLFMSFWSLYLLAFCPFDFSETQ